MSTDNEKPVEESTLHPTPLRELSVLEVLERIQRALELLAQDRDSLHTKLDRLLTLTSDTEEAVEDLGRDLEELASDIQDVVFDDAYPGSSEED
jgi:chromosome segregation ATPase